MHGLKPEAPNRLGENPSGLRQAKADLSSTQQPAERLATIVQALRRNAGVTWGPDEVQSLQRHGSSGSKIGDQISAMPVRGRLPVKLPRQPVDDLVASGAGERFELAGTRRIGRPMKARLLVEPTSQEDWLSLARAAMALVVSPAKVVSRTPHRRPLDSVATHSAILADVIGSMLSLWGGGVRRRPLGVQWQSPTDGIRPLPTRKRDRLKEIGVRHDVAPTARTPTA